MARMDNRNFRHLGFYCSFFEFYPNQNLGKAGLAGIVGIWLIIAAFIPSLQQHTANMWNDVIVGIIFMIAGFAALGKATEDTKS